MDQYSVLQAFFISFPDQALLHILLTPTALNLNLVCIKMFLKNYLKMF